MRKELRSKSLLEKRRRKNMILGSLLAGSALALLMLFIWLSYHERFFIEEVEVEGAVKADESQIRNIVRDRLKGYAYVIFPRRNFAFASPEAMEKDLSSLSVVIKDAQVRRAGVKKLVVEIRERKPEVLWCESGEPPCFYADDEGAIFLPAPSFSGSMYPVYSSSILGDPVGQIFASESDLEKLESFRRFLENARLQVEGVYIKGEGHYEALIESGARIIFNLESIDQEATNLKSLLEAEKSAVDGFDINNLEYVDLRYGNKIFWKPLGESSN